MSEKEQSPVAIIDLGGKQHVVANGAKIQVNRLTNKEGETITATDMLSGATIQLKVVSHFLGKKVNGLKFKNKIRYIKHYGHRQHLTALEVVAEAAKPKTEPKAESKPAAKKAAPKKATVKKETSK